MWKPQARKKMNSAPVTDQHSLPHYPEILLTLSSLRLFLSINNKKCIQLDHSVAQI